MDEILVDLSAQNLTSAIEGNLFAIFSTFSKWPRAEVHVEVEVSWSMTDIPFPIFNSVLHAQIAPANMEAVISSIITQAKSRNVPLLWWTGPMTKPTDLGTYLERYGFISGGEIPGMAIILENLKELGDISEELLNKVNTEENVDILKKWLKY